MPQYLSAKPIAKVGKHCNLIYTTIREMAGIHLLLALVAGILGLVFQSAELLYAALCFVPLPVATSLALVGRLLHRKRTINGITYSAEMYALITDELRRRKAATNATRFIVEHPDHARCSQELGKELKMNRAAYDLDTIREFQSLVFSQENPEQAKVALLAIINERGITEPAAAREALDTFTSTETPLMSGAL